MHSRYCKPSCLPIAHSSASQGTGSSPPHADLPPTPLVNDWTQAHQAERGCRLTYSAEEHGWSAAAFHGQVDTYGAAVLLGRTAGGAVFGAYNPRGWIGEQSCIALHSTCAGPDLQAQHGVSLTWVAMCGIPLEHAHTSLPDTN